MAFGEAVEKLLEKIADFFDIFDLSFFISGALLFAAVVFAITLDDATDDTSVRRAELEMAVDQRKELVADADRALGEATSEWLGEADADRARKLVALRAERAGELKQRREELLEAQRARAAVDARRSAVARFADKTTAPLAIVGIFILGLLCFATGRMWPRRVSLDSTMAEATRRHELGSAGPLAGYVARQAWSELYTWLWAWLRESSHSESYKLLRRYWIMTAVYDGVAVALLVWTPLAYMGIPLEHRGWSIAAALVLVTLAVLCKNEAGRYYQYQVREIVATYAHVHAGSQDGQEGGSESELPEPEPDAEPDEV